MKEEMTGNLRKLTAEQGYIHKVGTEVYVRSVVMLPGESVDMYEEVSDKPAYGETEYRARVEKLIAERYSMGQEVQFAREKEQAGSAYTEYLEYVEECKLRAREELAAGSDAEGGENE